jgi:hypothetical protein
MGRVTITPVRKLAPTYSAGVPVSLDIGLELADYDPTPVKSETVSIGGARETIADRIDEIYSVKTVAIPLAERAVWRMLMHSISLGEEFQLDTEGTIAAPSTELGTFKMQGKYNENNIDGRYVTYAFKVVKV